MTVKVIHIGIIHIGMKLCTTSVIKPRDRDRETERHRQRQRQIQRQIDRQTDRQAGRRTDRQADRPTDRPTDRQTDRPTGKQTDRQIDRQTDTQRHRCREPVQYNYQLNGDICCQVQKHSPPHRKHTKRGTQDSHAEGQRRHLKPRV